MNQQKKLRLVLASLKEKQLFQYFDLYADYYLLDLKKNIKKISFNCYEFTIQYKGTVTNGYGKNSNQAYASGITNFLERQFQDQKNHNNLRQCLIKYSLVYNSSTSQQPSQKVKTLPDSSGYQKKSSTTKMEVPLRPKQNIMKSVKTIKQQIFQSLNHENINLKPTYHQQPQTLNKNSSYSMLQQSYDKNQQLAYANNKIKQLQSRLAQALQQNSYLRSKLKQKEKENKHVFGSSANLQKSLQQPKIIQKDNYLKDISTKINTNQNFKDTNQKIRSYSLSNSFNPSTYNNHNNKNTAQKIKIPKLNLQILPNYHGKSNKSLNQSMLQNYEKKNKPNV